MNINKGNILIVDDILANLQLLSNTLLDQGYKVRGAAQGKMAIRTAILSPPDLILLDIKMPGMSGYEVCQQLKSYAQTAEVPIIFISALDESFDKVKAFKIGAVDYITKPFQIEEVLARIEHQMTIKFLQEQLQNHQQKLQEQNQKLEQEIENRKQAERAALDSSMAKSQFIARVSHGFRTPMNSILGFTELMLRHPEINQQHQEYLKIIHQSGEHLLELINEVLNFSKIEAGVIEFKEKNINLYRLIDNLEEMFKIKALEKKIELFFQISPQVPQNIKTDEHKLRVCLINLLGNGIKFTNHGSVTLCVTIESEELKVEKKPQKLVAGGRNYLCFSICDTGPGIAPEEMHNLFQEFRQTSLGMATMSGTGLGLAIAKKFVEIMGGQITVSSVLQQGTTFNISLPLNLGEESRENQELHQQVIGLAAAQNLHKILVVDDNKANCILLIELLESVGFEVKGAQNGQAGLEIWKNWQPDLIFTDIRMPVMGGLELTKEIRAMENKIDTEEQRKYCKSSRTVIVALTASIFGQGQEDITSAPWDDLLPKPLTAKTIFNTISKHLRVSYIYQDLSECYVDSQATKLDSVKQPDLFWQEQLGAMPKIWVTQLLEAAYELNEDLIIQLIEQIPEPQVSLAKTLREMVYNYRMDLIIIGIKTIINS